MQRLQAEQLEGREVLSAVQGMDGVLTLTAGNAGATALVYGSADNLIAVIDVGDGRGFQQFAFSGVTGINFVGGAGNDLYLNNTSVADVAVGGAGNDFLIGGYGVSSLSGGDGEDAIFTRGTQTTVNGGAGVDYVLLLTGTNTQVGGSEDLVVNLAGAGIG